MIFKLVLLSETTEYESNYIKEMLKCLYKTIQGVGEVVQWLRVLADPAEDMGSVLSTHKVVYN